MVPRSRALSRLLCRTLRKGSHSVEEEEGGFFRPIKFNLQLFAYDPQVRRRVRFAAGETGALSEHVRPTVRRLAPLGEAGSK